MIKVVLRKAMKRNCHKLLNGAYQTNNALAYKFKVWARTEHWCRIDKKLVRTKFLMHFIITIYDSQLKL